MTSVLSGRTNAELAARAKRAATMPNGRSPGQVKAVSSTGSQKGLLPVFLEPSLQRCPQGAFGRRMGHEIKFDSYICKYTTVNPSS
jgi:hypothetical protein